MTEFQDKIRTIGVSLRKGTSERKPVIDERDGTLGGVHVEHWDDSQDAVVQPKTIHYKMKHQEVKIT